MIILYKGGEGRSSEGGEIRPYLSKEGQVARGKTAIVRKKREKDTLPK